MDLDVRFCFLPSVSLVVALFRFLSEVFGFVGVVDPSSLVLSLDPSLPPLLPPSPPCEPRELGVEIVDDERGEGVFTELSSLELSSMVGKWALRSLFVTFFE